MSYKLTNHFTLCKIITSLFIADQNQFIEKKYITNPSILKYITKKIESGKFQKLFLKKCYITSKYIEKINESIDQLYQKSQILVILKITKSLIIRIHSTKKDNEDSNINSDSKYEQWHHNTQTPYSASLDYNNKDNNIKGYMSYDSDADTVILGE